MIDGPVHGPLVADQNKVCVGKSVQLSTGSQVQGNFIWQEFSKGTGSWKNLPGAGNTEIVFPYDSSLYRAVISKNGCTDTTNAVWVTTLPSPTAGIAAAGNTTFCAGENVILNATTGNGYRYQWQKDTVTITGAMVSNLTVGAAGSYRVIVRLTNGCADTSGSVTIKVNPNPPVPVITRIGMTLDAGIPGFNYQWYDNNIPVPGANGQTFAMIKGGNYTVKVTNGFGCFMMSVPYNNSGLDQDEPVHSMEVYPNPSTGMFYITEKVSQVSIYDMTGREVQGGLGADANSFDLSACAPGMYQVYITKGQQKFTLKIIKYDR
jgi:hypothetical protein